MTIRTGTLDSLQDSQHRPHIAQRGIKFNIPLDLRTPGSVFSVAYDTNFSNGV